MFSWGQSQFDDAVEKATSELRLAEEDIALNLEICDQIRSKAVPPRDAARALRRRLAHRNPNVQLLTLALTDVCVKNGGDHFLVEVAGKEFMDNMVSLLTAFDANPDVNSRILRLVQNWATAFAAKPALAYVAQVYKDLATRGFEFPPKDPVVANSAMIDTSTAPEWIDSDLCLRCRTPFSFTNRKHHCRNCGQVFDQQCSAHSMPLPHFGIAQEVRVCDSCYRRLSARPERKERSQSVDFHAGHHSRPARHRDAADADLQRAIQLSLAEASGGPYARASWHSSEPPLIDRAARPAAPAEEDDPELRAAIEASLREAHAPRPSAPYAEPEPDPIHAAPTPEPAYGAAPPPLPVLPHHDLHPREEDAILTFSQTVHDEPGTARRDLARVHALYDQASGLRPKLALSLDDAGRKEQMLGEMHEKLSHAVKLYDKLLTDQLARPVWQRSGALSRAGTWHAGTQERQPYRADGYPHAPGEAYQRPQPAQAYQTQQQPYQTQQQPYQTQQQPAQAYQPPSREPSQVYQAPSQPEPSQPYHQPQAAQPYQQPSQPYQAPQPAHEYQPRDPAHEYQQLPQREPAQSYQPPPAQPYPQPAPGPSSFPQQTWARPAYEQPPPTPAQQQPPPPTPVHEQQRAPQYHPPPQPVAAHPAPAPAPVAQPQYTAPPASQPQYTAPAAAQPQYPAPAAAQPQYTVPPAAQLQPTAPVQSAPAVQSPPAAQSYFQPAPAAQPPPSAQPATYQPVHSPPAAAAQSFYQTHAPMFPTAPTSNPQTFPLYGPGAPLAGLEQTEKKEVALIDL